MHVAPTWNLLRRVLSQCEEGLGIRTQARHNQHSWYMARVRLALEGEPDRLMPSNVTVAAGWWTGRAPLTCFSGLGKRGLRKKVAL